MFRMNACSYLIGQIKANCIIPVIYHIALTKGTVI